MSFCFSIVSIKIKLLFKYSNDKPNKVSFIINSSFPLISYDIQEHLFVLKMIKHIEQKYTSTYGEISVFDYVSC